MRDIIEKEDVELVLRLYLMGDSIGTISYKTDYSIEMIKSIIRKNKKYNLDKYITSGLDIKIDEIKSLFNRGYTINCISHIIRSSVHSVMSILENNGAYEYNDHPFDENITVRKLKRFMNTISIGDKFMITESYNTSLFNNEYFKVIVKSKYPHFVMTDKGAFQYFNLYTGKKITE